MQNTSLPVIFDGQNRFMFRRDGLPENLAEIRRRCAGSVIIISKDGKGDMQMGNLVSCRSNAKHCSKYEIRVEDITVEVERKKIRNLHLRVYPPDGHVRVSAPVRCSEDTIRSFVGSRIDWIRKHQARIRQNNTHVLLKFSDGELHFYQGKPYRLKVIEKAAKPHVETDGDTLLLYVRPGADEEKRRAVLEEFYRNHLRQEVPVIIDRWAKKMNVSVGGFGIKKMKTKWGTCNIKARRIWINLELAKKPPECLEYIVVHELAHLLERYHNSTFYGYMDRFLPQWRIYKKELDA